MVFTRKSQQSRRDPAHLECRVVLLTLRDRRSSIEFAGHDERRRRHVSDVHKWRLLQPLVRLLPEWRVEEVVCKEGTSV